MKLSCPSCSQTIEVDQFSGADTLNCANCGATIPITAALKFEATTFVPEQSQFTSELLASVGQYEILEEIARGGMGIVFKARQRGLNRIVALKMLLAGSSAERDHVARFYAEAEAVASLDHPGIVPVYEVGKNGDQIFLSMAYLETGTLSKRLQESPLTYREIASIMQSVALAVQFAHEHGVIHRDLKPSNILLDREGRPIVSDFGLAKNLNINNELTLTGQIVGTPAYMSPEQAAGQSVGPSADIYSLGATLYKMLTGRAPFHSDTPHKTLAQVISCDPVRVQVLSPDVPKNLQTICEKCLQKEVKQRYLSAQDLADDLGRWLRNEPIQARPVSLLEKTRLWIRRRPTVAIATAAISAALLLVFVLILTLRSSREDVRQFETKNTWNQYLRQIQLTDRLLLLARSPDYAEAIKTADTLMEERKATPLMYYDLACVYSLATEQVKLDSSLSPPERQSATDQLARKALNSLELSWKRGYFQNVDQWALLLIDTDFDPIRHQPAFEALTTKIEASIQ